MRPDNHDTRQMFVNLKIFIEKYNLNAAGVIIIYLHIESIFNNMLSHYKEPLLIGEFNTSKNDENYTL